MAILLKNPAPGHWAEFTHGAGLRCVEYGPDGRRVPDEKVQQCCDYRQHFNREEKSLKALDPMMVWSTPIADGYAHYFVVGEEPRLTVRHIPYMDQYRALPATIRGLGMIEILMMRRNKKRHPALFT